MTHAEVLQAELPVPADAIRYCRCGQLAIALWPAINGCTLAEWHCEKCLAEAKQTLLVALGSQSFIPT